MTGFYDAGPLGQVAINLFHGCGYDFYRAENQLRADDQRVRALACDALNRARASVSAAEADYRRSHIRPPSREHPFPDPEVVTAAQVLERMAQAIGGLEGQVRAAPVPANDRMTQRYRNEAETLLALAEQDKLLVGRAELLREMLDGWGPDDMLGGAAQLQEGIAALGETLRQRAALLL